MNKIWIYLDDKQERVPFVSHNIRKGLGVKYSNNSDWIIVRCYDEFKEAVNKYGENIEIVSFDHDIDSFDSNGEEMTGKNAAEYLSNYCQDHSIPYPGFYVHSDNNRGREYNILVDQLLGRYRRNKN